MVYKDEKNNLASLAQARHKPLNFVLFTLYFKNL